MKRTNISNTDFSMKRFVNLSVMDFTLNYLPSSNYLSVTIEFILIQSAKHVCTLLLTIYISH